MKPMRAGKLKDMKDLSKLQYPLFASFKLDGIRAYNENGNLLSKSSKKIPNLYTQSLFGIKELHGIDAELVVGPPNLETTMRDSTSGMMSVNGEPAVVLYAFDDFSASGGYAERHGRLKNRLKGMRPYIVVLEQKRITNEKELLTYEQVALSSGYEGLMLRALNGSYKQGTSTENEGYMLKFKRFADAEAVVLGMSEKQHNANEKDASGKRTAHKAGKTGLGTLGVLHVRSINGPFEGVEHDVSGFTAEMALWIWNNWSKVEGKILTYKFFPSGTQDKPRFPNFKSFRDPRDM